MTLESLATLLTEVISFNLKHIVQYASECEIESAIEDNNTLSFTIKSHDDDRGKIIGKHGSMIRSLRTIIRSIAAKMKVRTILNIIDKDGNTQQIEE
jgi:predicted RNA-binding protein YlqC (UPF0109 family)